MKKQSKTKEERKRKETGEYNKNQQNKEESKGYERVTKSTPLVSCG